eukprot:2540762-Lingulodinium_polyedra.AAC.1
MAWASRRARQASRRRGARRSGCRWTAGRDGRGLRRPVSGGSARASAASCAAAASAGSSSRWSSAA